jgi:hypothetical protein
LYFLLTLDSIASGQNLKCSFGTDSFPLWPRFDYCEVGSVDLPEYYRAFDYYSFSGDSTRKSTVSVVYFGSPHQIDFVPKEILSSFPRLNGILISSCRTFTILRNNLFTENLSAIQYLNLGYNQIESIEANAFQHLTKLKWIGLAQNQLSSLPHQVFKNNPELIAIWLHRNKISSITPDFFNNLNNLQYVYFGTEDQRYVHFYSENLCIKKNFGCSSGSCLVSKSEMDSGLPTCYANCLNDVQCASKSGTIDNLSPEDVKKNIDLIVKSGHVSTLIKKGYSSLLAEKGYDDLIAENDSKLEVDQEPK